ncbi:MAG: FixH family protein, partial [Gemmatimonadota bacterium]|nr:FixH family protein [Gemmatimonadota bacterium]
KKGWGWPVGVAAILAATVGLNAWVYRVANDDPSFAVEPDYYRKAVDWDSTLAQRRQNLALGWRLAPRLEAFTLERGALLQITLTDAGGAPIRDATVKVAAFFNARANDIVDSTLAPDSAGYAVRLPVRHGGVWELQFDVRRGGQRFTSIARVEAVPAGKGL